MRGVYFLIKSKSNLVLQNNIIFILQSSLLESMLDKSRVT